MPKHLHFAYVQKQIRVYQSNISANHIGFTIKCLNLVFTCYGLNISTYFNIWRIFAKPHLYWSIVETPLCINTIVNPDGLYYCVLEKVNLNKWECLFVCQGTTSSRFLLLIKISIKCFFTRVIWSEG